MYLTWHGPHCLQGNQLFGISSAFAVALLTERAFLIDDAFFARAFYSPHIQWNALATARHSSDTEDTQKTSTPVLAAGLNDVGKKVVSLNDCKAETELEPAAALSWDLEQVIGPQNFTEINTNVLWWPWLFRNPRYMAKVASWGMRSMDDFFPCAMNYLLQPTDYMKQSLNPLLEKMHGHMTVGLQMRMNPETAQVRVEDWRHMVECAKKKVMRNFISIKARNNRITRKKGAHDMEGSGTEEDVGKVKGMDVEDIQLVRGTEGNVGKVKGMDVYITREEVTNDKERVGTEEDIGKVKGMGVAGIQLVRGTEDIGKVKGMHVVDDENLLISSVEDIRWVIATDVPAVLDSLIAHLGEDKIVWWDAPQDDGTGVAVNASSSPQELHDWEEHQLKRVVDHYALSMANFSVISFASTFGLTAAVMHPGRNAHYSFGRHYHQNVAPMCERSPCGADESAGLHAHAHEHHEHHGHHKQGHEQTHVHALTHTHAHACFTKAFGYFDICSPGAMYGHGEQFLAFAAGMNAHADDEPGFDEGLQAELDGSNKEAGSREEL
jgi:hypothetical protein